MKQFILLLFLLPLLLNAQTENKKIFSVDDFIQQVKQYHPLAKQANIQVKKAQADLQSARGNFDPSLAFSADRKTFDGTNYYYYNNPELKIPTPLPLDIKTGLEDNGGKYLSSEVTNGQTSYVGVEMNLAKGLITDKRRTFLKQAKIFQSQTEQEKLKAINDLLFDAYVAYWQWAGAFQQQRTFNTYVNIATNRLKLITIGYVNGDKALTDTIEAFVQLQNYQMQLADALIKFNTASLELSNYLWLANDSAYALPNNYLPDTVQFNKTLMPLPLDQLVNQAITVNPSLKMYNYKLDALEAEKKLKFQSLLPTLNVKANLLNKGYNVFNGIETNYLQNNYKYGVEFKMPLFIREGRGDYKKVKLKIEETNLEYQSKKWQIENKVKNYFNEATLLLQQLTIAQNAYYNYDFLLRNEVLKFNNGESSLFMINSREAKLIEMQQKIIELKVKYYKARYATEWSAGLLK
jgi:outer membrane protein TolC